MTVLEEMVELVQNNRARLKAEIEQANREFLHVQGARHEEVIRLDKMNEVLMEMQKAAKAA